MGEHALGVVTCDVVRSEMERAIGNRDIPLKAMDYALHATPKEMPVKLNEAVSAMGASGCPRVALGYGLCSNGTVGVKSEGELVIPRCHDCISMLLGSPERYMEVFNKCPGTYFLSDGWMRNAGDPLSTVELRYAPKMGEKRAMKGMALEIANYKYVCLINNGVGDIRRLRERAKENCLAFKKEFMELPADLSYFEALLDGPPYKASDFIALEAGEPIMDHQFYSPIRPTRELNSSGILPMAATEAP
ncbi:MAG: DUF1638 domain-containing protein [Deltaproteobacteria bacterium]|jgi:hypothetical protein|nr:DUF1638 domain-containing protein [Deltaproteobacteria bacterium]